MKRKTLSRSTYIRPYCETCKYLGMRLYKDGMMHDESWHECKFAKSEIGLVEAKMESCGYYERKGGEL